jgi:hypothetical protein
VKEVGLGNTIQENIFSDEYVGIQIDKYKLLVKSEDNNLNHLKEFLSADATGLFSDNTTINLDGEDYNLDKIVQGLEQIKVELLENDKYYDLTEKERLILDIPVIMWRIDWYHAGILMYHWFTTLGDNNVNFNNFKNFIYNIDWLKERIDKESVRINNADYLFNGYTNNLQDLINQAKNLEVNSSIYIPIGEDYSSDDDLVCFNSFKTRDWDLVKNGFDNFAGSFGKALFKYYFAGSLKRIDENTAEITIIKVVYRIENDFFDFAGPQPLGTWHWNMFAPKIPEVGWDITNGTFRNYYKKYYNKMYEPNKAPVTNDFYITTEYVEINDPFSKIIIDLETSNISIE